MGRHAASGWCAEAYSVLPSPGLFCLASIRVGSAFVSVRIGSVRLDAVRRVFGLPRFGPSILGAFRVGSESPPLGSSRYGTETDLELELVERPAR